MVTFCNPIFSLKTIKFEDCKFFFFKIILKTAVVFQGCRQTNWELIYPWSFALKIDHFAGACFPKRLNLLGGGAENWNSTFSVPGRKKSSDDCQIHVVFLYGGIERLLTEVEVNSGGYLRSREAAREISTTFTNAKVNNIIVFSMYHTSWKTNAKNYFICDN